MCRRTKRFGLGEAQLELRYLHVARLKCALCSVKARLRLSKCVAVTADSQRAIQWE